MPENTAKIGIIGLAVMGSNFARNLAGKGIPTAVYNRTTKVTKKFLTDFGNEQLIGSETLEKFVASLEKPHKIILLVKSGEAVDSVIKSLLPLLDKKDIIIDFGNSHFTDTERRASMLEKHNIHFWGCGISGGEKGALQGPSLMPGGPKESWPEIRNILETAAAKDFSGTPCVTYLGPGSAGNYTKMVHNGIEYGIMQLLAEAYEILSKVSALQPPQIAQIFKDYNRGKLNGFLIELVGTVLKKKDELDSGYLIDKVLDEAAQKGTGTWTAIDALEKGIATPTISAAVNSRIISGEKTVREKLAQIYNPEQKTITPKDTDKLANSIENALYAGIICSFAQGFDLIQKTSTQNQWNTNPAEVARIWQGGCIIRTVLLQTIEQSFKNAGTDKRSILEMPEISSILKDNIVDLQNIVQIAHENQIPVPAFSSTLDYLHAMTQKRSSANLIQALRDSFGAHTYKRINKEGPFHSEWQ